MEDSKFDRLRPAVLVRKVLLPPLFAGVAIACLLGALALTVTGGSRASAGKSLFAGDDGDGLASDLSIELEGTPSARDIRAARLPYDVRRRRLERHPYYDLYVAAQQRYEVPWILVASVHYQETGFKRPLRRKRSRGDAMSIARQLHRAQAGIGLGDAATRAVAKRYGKQSRGDVSAAMVIERARAWRLLGTIPLPGRGELRTPTAGVVGGCGYFGCPRPGHLHNGVDFLAPTGTPIHAVGAGKVVLVESPAESGGYGNFTCVQHRPHLASCYAHQSSIAAGLRVGSRVKRGEVIGLVGSTGSSSAPHLHFEIRRGLAACHVCAVDPLPLISGEVPQATVPRMLPAPSKTSSARAAPSPAGPPALVPAPAPEKAPDPATSPAAAPSRTTPADAERKPGGAATPAAPKGGAGPSGGDRDRGDDAVPSFDPKPRPGPEPAAEARPKPEAAPSPAAPAQSGPAAPPAASQRSPAS